MNKDFELIEKIHDLISEHLKDNKKYQLQWCDVVKDLTKIVDLVIIQMSLEEREYQQQYFEARLKALKITVNGDLNVSTGLFEKLNGYLNLYESLRLTKEQAILLIEKDLYSYHNKPPLTSDEIKRVQLEMQVENQRKRKGNHNGK